jgi:hypothetical protein
MSEHSENRNLKNKLFPARFKQLKSAERKNTKASIEVSNPPEALLYEHFGETSLHNSPERLRVMVSIDFPMG